MADYFSLTKPRITLMVLLSTFVGCMFGTAGPIDWALVSRAVLGTALSAAGAAALNMTMERSTDRMMVRTRMRPVAAGRIPAANGVLFGVGLACSGVIYLALRVNVSAALLSALTLALYLGLYTPLKRVTWLSMPIGAVPGALPPLIGWAAVQGRADGSGLFLFLLLFLWQFPHFLALSWMYRDDYERARLPMLSVLDRSGRFLSGQSLAFTVLLVLATLWPFYSGEAGLRYLLVALIAGGLFLAAAVAFAANRADEKARRLFFASVTYLPLILILFSFRQYL